MRYLDLRDLAKEYNDLADRKDDADDPLDDEEKERLAALTDLESELGTDNMAEYAENEPTMIPEEEFEEYAQDFAYDVGFLFRDDSNPLMSFIDWEGWADYLKSDYTEVEFIGDTYLIRTY